MATPMPSWLIGWLRKSDLSILQVSDSCLDVGFLSWVDEAVCEAALRRVRRWSVA